MACWVLARGTIIVTITITIIVPLVVTITIIVPLGTGKGAGCLTLCCGRRGLLVLLAHLLSSNVAAGSVNGLCKHQAVVRFHQSQAGGVSVDVDSGSVCV